VDAVPVDRHSQMTRGLRQKRYSVKVIMLHYIFALSHNALTVRRKAIASYSCCSGLIEVLSLLLVIALESDLIGIVIASYSYHSKVIKSL
jgi:hypothetical protein